MIPGSVIPHPIENDADLARMASLNQRTKFFQRSKIGIHSPVIADGIRTAEVLLVQAGICNIFHEQISLRLALPLANRLHRHQPDHINPQRRHTVKLSLESGNGALRRMLTQVYLVEQGIDSLLAHSVLAQCTSSQHQTALQPFLLR